MCVLLNVCLSAITCNIHEGGGLGGGRFDNITKSKTLRCLFWPEYEKTKNPNAGIAGIAGIAGANPANNSVL